jgi:hypothetical protein
MTQLADGELRPGGWGNAPHYVEQLGRCPSHPPQNPAN